MINEIRTKLIKEIGASTQTPIYQKFPRTIEDPDEVLLWKAFTKSGTYKTLREMYKEDVVSLNYNSIIAWYCFLNNHHIPVYSDFRNSYRQDLYSNVTTQLRDVLEDLQVNAVMPTMALETSGVRLIDRSDEFKKFNASNHVEAHFILLLVPARKRIAVDFKYKRNSVDVCLAKMRYYLYRNKQKYLQPSKELTIQELFNLTEFQWYFKDNLFFRHNKNSLAVMFKLDYPCLIDTNDTDLQQDFRDFAIKALRVIR